MLLPSKDRSNVTSIGTVSLPGCYVKNQGFPRAG